MPMGLTSTHFLSYRDIKIADIDLIDDAWGFNNLYRDVIVMLHQVKPVPRLELTEKLIHKIRERH
jgi:hypothetical protein